MTNEPRPVERSSLEPMFSPGDDPSTDADLTPEEQDVLAGSLFDAADVADAADAAAAAPEGVLKVRIVQVHGDDVFVDVGGKAEGVVSRMQFKEGDEPIPGRVIEVVFDRIDRGSNLQVFSREGAARLATWDTVKPGMIVEGRVTGMNKGGLEVDLKGIRAFMPASQVDVDRLRDISLLIGQPVRAEVLEVSRREKSVLISRRRIQEAEVAQVREKLLGELAEGQVCRGVVRSIMEYGAFVDLGGVDGLLHISDMSWSPVEKTGDLVHVGQEIDVKVLKIKKADDGKMRISLGLKQATPDPWAQIESRYAVGIQVHARIVRLAEFGAFAEIEKGVEALIPVSEMSWGRVNRPRDVVSIGQVVETVILRVEPDKRRIALSMKQASPDPWADVDQDFPQNAIVTGRVTKLTDFGAFVELRPGVEGLVHVSELSDQHVRTPADAVQAGQDVTVKVLSVNMDQRRVSLSVKAAVAAPPVETESAASAPAKTVKLRKRPLRGGWGSEGGGLFDGLLR